MRPLLRAPLDERAPGVGNTTQNHSLIQVNWSNWVRRSAAIVLLSSALAHATAAQLAGAEIKKSGALPAPIADPLGRTTPRSSINAFIYAVEREDFVAAARYMQLTNGQRRNTESLARDLKSLMDRYLSEALIDISDSATGALDDGLPIDQERVGPLVIGKKQTYITLVRLTDPQFGPVWLLSSSTLAQIPALRGAISQSWIERAMPEALVSRGLLGVSLAHWVVLAGTLLIPFSVLTLLSGIVMAIARPMLGDSAHQRNFDAWYRALRWPLVTALTLTIQFLSMPSLGFPLTFRIAYARVGLTVLVLAFTWLMRRILTLGFARARSMAWGKDRTSTQSLMLLAERLLKALVVLVAVFAILTIVGVNTKTALAGVGIGGIALALGAQRTVENLLGGVFLLSDRAIAVGDLCNISNHLGWIEDITLRSVRIRTLDRSLVSIPAGVLAQAGIENFATRDKILAQCVLRLRHGTSVDQLKRILEDIKRVLDAHPRIEPASSRICLIDFAAEAIELELFAYFLTTDIPEFLSLRGALLLEVAATVEAAGSGFAQPTQFIYMDEAPRADTPLKMPAVREPGPRAASLPR